jgi:Domain of unknown function (DUF1998)
MNQIGEIRPSQLIFTFGVASLIDLPNMSGLIMGLDDWNTQYCREIVEDRLLAAIKRRMGSQVAHLFLPPIKLDETKSDPGAPAIGVPVAPFPRWMRCPLCDTLATIDSGVFRLVQDQWRPDRTEYRHEGCTKARLGPPSTLSVRFLLACREGHLTDFPWVNFVHNNNVPCKPAQLSLREYGISGDASDIIVKCFSCNTERRMADAFDHDSHFHCPGHHPHLRRIDTDPCPEEAKAILLGASNSWFSVSLSALSIPQATHRLAKLVEDNWDELKNVESEDELQFYRKKLQKFQALIPLFADFKDSEIWSEIEAKRSSSQDDDETEPDIKLPEWRVLSNPESAIESRDFKLRKVAPPKGFEKSFEDTVLVERVREVRALLGYTRLESNSDFAEITALEDARISPISRTPPTWLPASEVRGEGIFLRLKEEVLQAWEARKEVQQLHRDFLESHKRWRQLRSLKPAHEGFPGIRFVFLHSLAHALIRQIVLDCGYTSASLRERLYCRWGNEHGGPMAGILIYTAAPDSEGTLGGLVELGNPASLGRHLQQALESMKVCASDPLCSEHAPSSDGRGIHGACCHAYLFAPETSCERGNRYLDRSVLVETFAGSGAAFFG